MISENTFTDYWLVIEPYIYVCVKDKSSLLYNTLDSVIIESENVEVAKLLQETLQNKSYGVVLLTNEKYKQKNINAFIKELHKKYMGDIIDVTLSKSKPIQIFPYINFSDKREVYKIHNFSPHKNVLNNLFEINIHVDHTTNIEKLSPFLQSLPDDLAFNIIGNMGEVVKGYKLLSLLNQYPSRKNIVCSYINVIALEPDFINKFFYRILIQSPIDIIQWNKTIKLLLNQTLPFEYIFEVSSEEDFLQAERLIEQFGIETYHLKPIYTGENINFFEENVFLTKEDILSTSMSIKDFFAKQSMNIHDFGKINIMPNGNVYANVSHPALGNIYTHSIYEIVQNEMEGGRSWLRIRNHAPCNTCIYQWLCPSPSNYEIAIGRPNLCHVEQQQI